VCVCELLMCCSVLQCVAVCCSVLQCVAVCCSVLQCVAVCCRHDVTHSCVSHDMRERERVCVCALSCWCVRVCVCVCALSCWCA